MCLPLLAQYDYSFGPVLTQAVCVLIEGEKGIPGYILDPSLFARHGFLQTFPAPVGLVFPLSEPCLLKIRFSFG